MGKSAKKKHKAAKLVRSVEEADAAVVDGVEPAAQTPPVRLLSFMSEIGDQPQLRTLCAAAIAAGMLQRSPRLFRAGVHMLIAHELATHVKDAIKLRIDRTRPRSRNGNGDHRMKSGKKRGKEDTSFPSGHSAGAMAVARAFSRHYPEHEKAALAAAGLVALAQIPRCAHYPSDVAGGVAIGLAAETAAALLPAPFGNGGTAAPSPATPHP